MGSKAIGWMSGGILSICAFHDAQAREVDPRIDAPLLRATYVRQPLRTSRRNEALALLGPIDRDGIRNARVHGVERQFGPVDLSLQASRIRGGGGGAMAMGDRYNASTLAVSAGFDLGNGLRIGPVATLMHMKRHFSFVPSGLRPRATDIAAAGLRLSRDDGPALSLDYVSTSRRTVRPLDRMAEIAGGAPLLGHGLRLGLTGGAETIKKGSLTWGLALSAVQRPRGEFGVSELSGAIDDKRAAFSVGMAF